MVNATRTAPRAAAGLASWQRGAVHVWGWDGVQSMAPTWLQHGFRDRGWPGPPGNVGFYSSLDLTAPNGERIRPMSIRLDATAGVGWLHGVGVTAHPSVRWFAALTKLAASIVDAGAVLPHVSGREERCYDSVDAALDETAATTQWVATGTGHHDAVAALAEAMPPICVPEIAPGDATRRHVDTGAILDAFVDQTVRARLHTAGWEPLVPRDRSAASATARSVFRCLIGQDSRIAPSRSVATDSLVAAGAVFDRQLLRSAGEPVLNRRVRLAVPADRFEPWRVELELVDEADPGRWCSGDDVWARTPLGVEVAGGAEHLFVLEAALHDAAQRIAARVDVLAELAEVANPSVVELRVDNDGAPGTEVDDFLDQAPGELERLGIALIGPEHLVRSSVAVRGTATPAPKSDRSAGLNRDTIVQWSYTATDATGPSAISEAELARAEQSGSSLLFIGQRWVRIDPAALRKVRARHDAYLLELEALAAQSPDGQVPPLALLGLAADVAAAGDELTADATGADPLADEIADGSVSAAWSGLLLGGLPDSKLTEVVEPPPFVGALRPYQRRGLSWLRFLHRLGLGGCLADDMGLGKTATTLAHLADRQGPHLVVCPLSVVHNWETEAGRFVPSMRVLVHHGAQRHAARDPQLDLAGVAADSGEAPTTLAAADLVVTTYGLATRDIGVLAEIPWETVVLDEAQFVKNPGTSSARAVRKLRAGQRVALTGTPVENRLSELWAILDWVNPGMLGSRESFRHRYSKPIERAEDPDLAAAAAAALKSLTQPFVLRRSKADRELVPELPDKIEQIAYAGLTKEQAVLYQKVVAQLLTDAENTDGMKRRSVVLAALTKLKQICNHPAHALGDGSRINGRSGKLARYDELIADLVDADERALVFTQFVEMGNLLQRHAAEQQGWTVPFLNGSVPKLRRDRMVAEFQAAVGPPLLLVSLKAGGTGLNLTAASQVIHYDRWWNPAVENQATDRAWRIGQGSTVFVHKLVCEGTVEERIAKMIDDKQRLADLVVGQGEAWLSELSTADLRDLVQLGGSNV